MTESMRDRLRDELAGWPIGSGYYSTTVSVDDARDMADAVLAVLTDPPFEVWERCVDRIEVDDMDQRNRENIVITVLRALLEAGEDDD